MLDRKPQFPIALLPGGATDHHQRRVPSCAVVCIFVTFQIFRYSRDPADMRNWVPIGLAVVPLALICAVVIW